MRFWVGEIPPIFSGKDLDEYRLKFEIFKIL